jgi:predicted metal-dependent hydrolase
MTTIVHGTVNGYNYHRCRCDDCCAAVAAGWRARRERATQAPDKQVPHGTRHGHLYYGCGCGPCREANRTYLREYRARRRAAS